MAIETPLRPPLAALSATGRSVYAINPLAVARYRERVDRISRPSPSRSAPASVDCRRDRRPRCRRVRRRAGRSRRIVGDTFLGDQLTAAVDDCDVVVAQSMPQNIVAY